MQSSEKQKDIHLKAQEKSGGLLLQMAKMLLEEKLLTSSEYTNILTLVQEEL